MKLILFFLLISFSAIAQTIDHPTIDKLDVFYRESFSAQTDTIQMPRVQTIITLKNEANVSVLHFKMYDNSNNSIVYQVDYFANSPIITDAEGFILFKKEGLDCFIATANKVLLNTYLYEISTEDSQGNLTEVYSELK